MKGKIIGLVGPSGVGKGYAKEAVRAAFSDLAELTVVTTREKRPSNGLDREASVSKEEFLRRVDKGEIIFPHRPFRTTGDWYGFIGPQVDSLLDSGKKILTEVHVDNVRPFKERYPNQVFLIALVSDEGYLAANIKRRGTETVRQLRERLDVAKREVKMIKRLFKEGFLDSLIEVNWQNREHLTEIAVEKVGLLITRESEAKKPRSKERC